MNKRILVLATLVFAFAVAGFAQAKKQTTKAEPVKYELAAIKVESAVCNSCANTIEKALKKVGGVKSAKVDIDKKVATVKYVATKANLSQLETAIANAGYDANDTTRNKAAYDKLDACCKIDGDM
ncbi:MAG: heavy-metal-associated domain-containing protein [Ignavibacteriales bacterium]|nr:heavy-metal-associated domain-containing protein [Ignavibacteriales bacterium]